MAVAPRMSPWQQWQQRTPDKVALRLEQESLTWQQLAERVEQYAQALHQQGLQSGDVLTLVGKNHPHTLLWLLAAASHGVICALTMPQPEQALLLKLDALYGAHQKPHLWLAPGAEVPRLSDLLHTDSSQSDSSQTDSCQTNRTVNFIEIPQALHATEPAGRPVEWHGDLYQADNLATLIFTSGSTGTPKAVAHTHAQHLASAQGLLQEFVFSAEDTWLLSLPLYHVSGLAIVYRWLLAGGCLKIGSADLACDMAQVTHASLVPTQLKRLLDAGIELSLTHVLLGGSHIPVRLAQQAAETGIETWLGYGMTEAASTVTAKRVDGHSGAGHVLAGRQVQLRGQRIYIGGETLAKGYYRQGILHPVAEPDGWFDSKDLGAWQDEQLVIIGRADNQFISGGENIHCEEIEAVLSRHPAVQLAMVVAVEDDEFGARPVAVVHSAQAEFSLEQGAAWCEGKLEKFKWPVAYFTMPEQLMNSGIKVSRQALKQWLAHHQTRYRVMS